MPSAQCQCGSHTLSLKQSPVRVSICHCYDCQKRTGSPFAEQAMFVKEALTLKSEGHLECFQRLTATGSINFHFCQTCGNTLYYTRDDKHVLVPVGLLAQSEQYTPEVSVYQERCHAWLTELDWLASMQVID